MAIHDHSSPWASVIYKPKLGTFASMGAVLGDLDAHLGAAASMPAPWAVGDPVADQLDYLDMFASQSHENAEMAGLIEEGIEWTFGDLGRKLEQAVQALPAGECIHSDAEYMLWQDSRTYAAPYKAL